MVSAINFGTSVNNGYISDKQGKNGEKVVIMKKEPKGPIRESMSAIANIRKAYVVVTEGAKGVAKAIGSAFVAGGSVMGLDWLIQRLSGNKVAGQSLLLTPLKTAGNLIAGVAKKVGKAFAKDTSFMQVMTYPFVGFPKDVFNYVKNAKGGSKAGKAVAITVGLAALAYSAFKTLLAINKKNADIDHEYRIGHNA